MTERRKKYLRFAYPILGVFWLWFGWSAGERSDPMAMWAALAAGVVHLAAGVQFEWKIRRERRLSELRAEEGDDDSSAGHWWAGDEPSTGARQWGGCSTYRERLDWRQEEGCPH